MRFANHLREIGDAFRLKYLHSTDENDLTELEEDWTKMKVKFDLSFIIIIKIMLFYIIKNIFRYMAGSIEATVFVV